MAVKLYGLPFSSCTTRAMLALEEMGVDYELVPVNFSAGEHKQPPHLSRNPFGQIPALEDGDLTLFESRAISKYVARKHKGTGTGLLGDGGLQESALVDVWLQVESQQYNPAVAPIVYETLVAPAFFGRGPDEEAVAAAAGKLGKVLDVYEARLAETRYLAGDFYSLADLHHVSYTHYLMATPHRTLVESRPHVKAWWEDVSSRPASEKVRASMSFVPSGES